MNNIQAATKIQSLTRGYFTRKTIRQNLETPPVSFSNLPNGPLITMCSLLDLNTRLSLTLTSKQFSPLETRPIQTQSLFTAALQKLATDEAIQWINEQLQLVGQNPIELIKKIANKEVVIPDYLVKQTVSNILANQAIEVANTIPLDENKFYTLRDIIDILLASKNVDQAIEVANTIPDNLEKSFLLKNISITLSENGNFDQAIDVANTIPSDYYKSIALNHQSVGKIVGKIFFIFCWLLIGQIILALDHPSGCDSN